MPVGQWQRLTLDVAGRHFRVSLNDRLVFAADDPTFCDAGKVGLWTRADSVTSCDDLTIQSANAR